MIELCTKLSMLGKPQLRQRPRREDILLRFISNTHKALSLHIQFHLHRRRRHSSKLLQDREPQLPAGTAERERYRSAQIWSKLPAWPDANSVLLCRFVAVAIRTPKMANAQTVTSFESTVCSSQSRQIPRLLLCQFRRFLAGCHLGCHYSELGASLWAQHKPLHFPSIRRRRRRNTAGIHHLLQLITRRV